MPPDPAQGYLNQAGGLYETILTRNYNQMLAGQQHGGAKPMDVQTIRQASAEFRKSLASLPMDNETLALAASLVGLVALSMFIKKAKGQRSFPQFLRENRDEIMQMVANQYQFKMKSVRDAFRWVAGQFSTKTESPGTQADKASQGD